MDAYAQPSDKSFFNPTDVDDTPKSRENPPWGWVWEIGQTLVALGSTVYLVYLLTHYDNRPLDDWRFHGLSFQATLAILSTAARAGAVAAVGTCLSQYKWLYFLRKPHRLDDLDVLDEASRGTLGSLRFLFIRVPSLATVGALLTIISLAYGAFIQQLVELKPEDIFVDDPTALLGLSHVYNGGAAPVGHIGTVFDVRAMTGDVKMQGAIYRGLFNLSSPPVFNCTSAQCLWPGTHVSLGFAATCADVTTATLDAHGNATGVWGAEYWNYPNMTLTTPGGVLLNGTFVATDWQTVVSLGAKDRTQSTIRSSDKEGHVSPTIVRVAALRIKSDPVNYWPQDPYNDMEIVECDIDLVAYRYTNGFVAGGDLSFRSKEVLRLGIGNASVGRTDQLIYDVDFIEDGLPTLSTRTHDLAAIQQFFTSDRFSGSIYDGIAAPPSVGLGNAFLEGDMIEIFHSMVDSMTDQLRTNFSQPATATGRSTRTVIFIRVRWPWLILPAAGIGLSILFVILIIGWTCKHRNSVPPWKNKITPVLMHRIEFRHGQGIDSGSVAHLVTGFRSVEGLEQYTKRIEVQLDRRERRNNLYKAVPAPERDPYQVVME